jgi:hypothetical protein
VQKLNKNPLLELICVLLVAIVVLTVYSFADEQITLYGLAFKKAGIRKTLVRETPAVAQKDSIPVISVAHVDSVVKQTPDTSSQYILLTGDSMAEGLMFALKKYAKYNGHTLKTKIWYGSSTVTWAQTDTLQKMIALYHPSFVIFTLGSNELFIRDIEEREVHIQDIIKQAGKTKFIWVGPPNWKKDTGINDLLSKNLGPGRFFVSKDLTFERASDGRHPSRAASAIWADTISTWIMQASHYPIRLDKPVPAQLSTTK